MIVVPSLEFSVVEARFIASRRRQFGSSVNSLIRYS